MEKIMHVISCTVVGFSYNLKLNSCNQQGYRKRLMEK